MFSSETLGRRKASASRPTEATRETACVTVLHVSLEPIAVPIRSVTPRRAIHDRSQGAEP